MDEEPKRVNEWETGSMKLIEFRMFAAIRVDPQILGHAMTLALWRLTQPNISLPVSIAAQSRPRLLGGTSGFR